MTTTLTTAPISSAGIGPIQARTPPLDLGAVLRGAFPLVDRPPGAASDEPPVLDLDELVAATGIGGRLKLVRRHVGPSGTTLPTLIRALDRHPVRGVDVDRQRWLTACTVHAATLSGHLICHVDADVTRVFRGPRFLEPSDGQDLAIDSAAAAVHIGAQLVSANPLQLRGQAPPTVTCRHLPVRFLEAFVGRDTLDMRPVRAALVRELRATFGRTQTGWLDDELTRLVLLFTDLGWCRIVRVRKVNPPLIASTPLGLFGFVLLLIQEPDTTGRVTGSTDGARAPATTQSGCELLRDHVA